MTPIKAAAEPSREELTFEEKLLLASLAHGPRADHDTIPDRVLINRGLARRIDPGRIEITDIGLASLPAPAGNAGVREIAERLRNEDFATAMVGDEEYREGYLAGIEALKSALPQPREAEPVAWLIEWTDIGPRVTLDHQEAERGRRCAAAVTPLRASPSPIPEAPGGEIAALTKLAAECHRAKWQFDLSEDYRPTAKVARGLIAMAFRELHRVGDIALKMRDEIRALKPQDGGESGS